MMTQVSVPTHLVLIGPPGAGCSSVAAAWAEASGGVVLDLGEETARRLGVPADLALVAAGEERYRQAETEAAAALLGRLSQEPAVAAVALGSGCLGSEEVLQALQETRSQGTVVVALTATVRRLAHRCGLDAPRSVALGNVNHAFTLMARAREARCRQLADSVLDTTDTTPLQAAAALPGFPAQEATR